MRRLFETHDRLAELDDGALLDQRLRVVDDAVVGQESRFSDGRWHAESLTLRLERGLPFSAELDAATATLIRKLDGSNTLKDALVGLTTRWTTREASSSPARCSLSASSISPTELAPLTSTNR